MMEKTKRRLPEEEPKREKRMRPEREENKSSAGNAEKP